MLFSILINAGILYSMTYFLWANELRNIPDGITLGCWECWYSSLDAWKIYLVGGIILGVLNITLRPILKLLSLPLYLILFSLVWFIVNGIILYLFDYIVNTLLWIPWISYSINGTVNFIIAVAIFTFLNMFYSLLLFKK